jgi:16S rRNA (cytosine967-C5)-methyltransferase
LGKHLALKLHQNVLQGIIDNLEQIFTHNKYTDDVLEKSFKRHKQWGARDRRFIAETTYEMVRWWRNLLHNTQSYQEDPLVYQKTLAAHLSKKGHDLPDWLVTYQISTLNENPTRAITESIPDWLDQMGKNALKENWDKELSALNQEAKVFLRVNTLKTNTNSLAQILKKKGIETLRAKNSSNCLVMVKRQALANLEEYQQGLFEIQDIGSQEIAPFLAPKPEERIVDACAGGGGKTLHLAALMGNKGEIVALDIEDRKLKNLQQRTERAGIDIIRPQLVSAETIQELSGWADKLLLDVPCSGLGVLKRNPDAKWKLAPETISQVKGTQRQILEQYPDMLKIGGEMVYATCSIFPSENQEQIKWFLEKKGSQFLFLEEKQVWPSDGGDGFYMARLKRIE